jgi:hypothetical protein
MKRFSGIEDILMLSIKTGEWTWVIFDGKVMSNIYLHIASVSAFKLQNHDKSFPRLKLSAAPVQ